MKRLPLHPVATLLTFALSIALVILFGVYSEKVRIVQEDKLIESKNISRLVTTDHSLAAKLQRIDKIYRERCRMPDSMGRGNPAMIALLEFRSCNEEWAKARRDAINEEIRRYLTTL
jgi:hypothetical protein